MNVSRTTIWATTIVLAVATIIAAVIGVILPDWIQDEPPEFIFSEKGSLPARYSVVVPGSPVSLARATYPQGAFGHLHGEPLYEVEIDDGPFSHVLFYYTQRDDDADPQILYVTFMLRSKRDSLLVGEQVLQALGPETVRSFVDGRLIWDDLNGFKVEFVPNRILEYATAISPEVPLEAELPKESPKPAPEYGDVFQAGNPYPVGLKKIRLGTPISLVKQVYPSLKYSSGWDIWQVDIDMGPFSGMRFGTSGYEQTDPAVSSIEFQFKADDPNNEGRIQFETARSHVRSMALEAFGSDSVKSSNLGEILQWQDIDGARVEVSPRGYFISVD